MNSALQPYPAARVTPNLWYAFRGILWLTSHRRRGLRHLLTLTGLLAAFALVAGTTLRSATSLDEFVTWASNFHLGLLVPVIAFLSSAGSLRDDLKPGANDYLFTRPIARPVFVLFRYGAQMLCLQLEFLLAFMVLSSVGVYRHVPDLLNALPPLFLAQTILVAAFSARGTLCGVITSRYVILGLAYAVIVEIGVAALPNRIAAIAIKHQILQLVRGHLHLLGPAALTPNLVSGVSTVGVFILLTLGLAALIFSRQQHSGTRATDS